MKVIFSAVLLLTALFLNAQECVRAGALVQTDVNVKGTASLIHRGDSLIVSLSSNFNSDAGPDLDVYLSDEPNPVATGIRLEALQSLSGSQMYDVPSNIKIEDFNYISIHCTQYNHLYASAELGETSGNCSIALESVEVKLDKVKVFASNTTIKIKSGGLDLANYKAEIYSSNGQLLFTTTDAKSTFNVDTVGLYFVKLYSKDLIRTEKVLVK